MDMDQDTNLQTPPTPAPLEPNWLTPLPEMQPKKRHTKKWIILGVALIITLLLGVVAFFAIRTQMTPLCLTAADYATLTGESVVSETPFDPTIDFYGFDIPFVANSGSAYADENSLVQIRSLGTFYRQHTSSSIAVSLQAMYVVRGGVSTQPVVTERLTALTARLVSAGIKPDMISTHIKEYVEDPLGDSFMGADDVSLSVTSNVGCR